MQKVRLGFAVVLLSAALATPSLAQKIAAPGKATCPQTQSADNSAAAKATNRVREAKGLAPVRADARLAKAAARHACDMAARGQMTHRGSGTRGPLARVKRQGYRPRMAAENIAAGPFSLSQVLHAWNNSAGHLSNILIPHVRDYGIGHAVGADGTVYWASVYGAPQR